MAVLIGSLPDHVRVACLDLRDMLLAILERRLVGLWVHGAVVSDDRPLRSGDVDTYGVLSSPVARGATGLIDSAHERAAALHGIEWDSWYILEEDVAGASQPVHALREDFRDEAWALHRAHWIAGEYAVLHGPELSTLVPPPTWAELEEGLRSEFGFVDRIVRCGPHDAGHAAYAVLQSCRIIYSLRTRDVVVSKRAAAHWALEHLPDHWRPAIRAAERVYDGRPKTADQDVLARAVRTLFGAVRGEIA